jgi:hypothetical protein
LNEFKVPETREITISRASSIVEEYSKVRQVFLEMIPEVFHLVLQIRYEFERCLDPDPERVKTVKMRGKEKLEYRQHITSYIFFKVLRSVYSVLLIGVNLVCKSY